MEHIAVTVSLQRHHVNEHFTGQSK